MAGANNAQMKAAGYSPKQIEKRRAEAKGPLTMAAMGRLAPARVRSATSAPTLKKKVEQRAPSIDLRTADPKAFSDHVLAAAKASPTGKRDGGDKVFVSHVFDELQRRGSTKGMTLDEFKGRIQQAWKTGTLRVARADLVEDMNPRDVSRSEVTRLNTRIHFIRID